jgi:signal transduction histidine kinase
LPHDVDQLTAMADTGVQQRLAESGNVADVGRHRIGLPAKLLLLTLLFVMLAEVFVFLPSIANFRLNWLNDRLVAAQLAALAAEAVPNGAVPPALRMELLRTAQVKMVALKRNDQRILILPEDMPTSVDGSYDLRSSMRTSLAAEVSARARSILEALAVFVAPGKRLIRIVGEPNMGVGDFIEVVLPEAPLRKAMVRYALNILVLSIVISMFTSALVYLALNSLLVRPIMRMTANMLHFSKRPEDASRIIVPSSRTDEIGVTERELAHMQRELSQLLAQKNRLAALGLAVSKINHDLRNMLATAQIVSDRLVTVDDPQVQRFAPKLLASLDRAINFCNDTLRFGRAAEAAPRREMFALAPLLDDVGDGLGLPRGGLPRGSGIDWRVTVDRGLQVDADRDQMYRVLSNLCRNAIQAIEAAPALADGREHAVTVKADRRGQKVIIDVADTGPGIATKARAHLFQAFQASTRRGGSGLGLAIAQELVTAHGGTIELMDITPGTTFRIEIPDRDAVRG